jgi:hypothetical protein
LLGVTVKVGAAVRAPASISPELEELLDELLDEELLLEELLLEELVELPLVPLELVELVELLLVLEPPPSSSPPQAMPAAAPPISSVAKPTPRKLSFNLMPIIVLPLHAYCMEHYGPIGTSRHPNIGSRTVVNSELRCVLSHDDSWESLFMLALPHAMSLKSVWKRRV